MRAPMYNISGKNNIEALTGKDLYIKVIFANALNKYVI